MKAPKKDKELYVTRKYDYTIQLQEIINTQFKFIDIFVGYLGSCSDSRVFREFDIYQKTLETPTFYFLQNEHIFNDEAYLPLSWSIPPYINRERLTEEQTHFNFKIL